KIRMTESVSGQYLETDLTYDSRTRRITFRIPDGFENAKVYRFEVVNIPRQVNVIDQNIQRISKELNINDAGGTATLTTKILDGEMDLHEAKAIYSTRFRTSRYNTFVDKMKHVNLSPPVRLSVATNAFQLATVLTGDESFEESEVSGSPAFGQLIRAEAILEGNTWFETRVYPLVYDGYPLLGWMTINRRNPDVLGVPPVKDVYLTERASGAQAWGDPEHPVITPFRGQSLVYNLGQSVASDHSDIQRHAVNYVADHPAQLNARLEALVLQPMPYIRYGRYRIRINYVVPGIDKISSFYETEIFNRIPDNE
ncbi:MAG TPA: hypothetical protein VF490_15670, partial [Chryseosolibacter sp.]